MAEIKDWDILAANNNDAPPDGWPENMNYSDVNNAAREGMAVLARFYKDTNGSILSTGAGNTYTLAINRTIGTLANGDGFRFRADKANTGAITIDIGTASAEGVRPDGSSFVAGEIVANGIYDVAYSATLSKFVVLGSEIVATEASKGVVEFATNAEHLAGASTSLATNPAGVDAMISQAPLIPSIVTFTSTGATTWDVPSNKTKIKIKVVGGGAGNGDNTLAGRSKVTGAFGTVQADGGNVFTGGVATGGDLNIQGGVGSVSQGADADPARGGGNPLGFGATDHGGAGQNRSGTGYGAGGARDAGASAEGYGAGGYAEKIATVTGGETLTINVGANGGNGSTDGIVIIEY